MTQLQTNERQLTLKQRKWLELYIKTGNATQAAMEVYDCKDRESAAQIGWENIRKLDFSHLMEEAGVTDKELLNTLRDGLVAKRVVSARITGKDADAQTDDFIEVDDHQTRHKYLETALRLKKRLGNDSGPSIQINNLIGTKQEEYDL